MKIMVDDDSTKFEIDVEPGDGMDGVHIYVVITVDEKRTYEGRLFLSGETGKEVWTIGKKNKTTELLEQIASSLRQRPFIDEDADEFEMLAEVKEICCGLLP